MRGSGTDGAGFSLIEIVIAMFLLGVIAVAILPALWQGIVLSSQQAVVATATRELNSIIDEARQSTTCAKLTAAAVPRNVDDGNGGTFRTSGSVGSCASGKSVSIVLTAGQGTVPLATVSALVFVP